MESGVSKPSVKVLVFFLAAIRFTVLVFFQTIIFVLGRPVHLLKQVG
jgi:hypothetical protein